MGADLGLRPRAWRRARSRRSRSIALTGGTARRYEASGALLQLLRETFSVAVRYSALPSLVPRTVARRKVTILLYHDPRPTVMERHLDYLAANYTFITLARLVDAIADRNWDSIPERSLVLTFDDGHKGNFELLELFERHDVTPTIYICSQIADTDRHFWFFETNDFQTMKRLPNEERLALLRDRVGYFPTRGYGAQGRQALSGEEIALMKHRVDFQAHSRFHPVLTTCSDAECVDEIVTSKREVEALVGKPCIHFSFPNGDYTARELELVRQAGYASARTVDFGWNGVDSDPYRLKIFAPPDNASVNRLAADLTGATGVVGRLRRRSLSGKHRPIVSRRAR